MAAMNYEDVDISRVYRTVKTVDELDGSVIIQKAYLSMKIDALVALGCYDEKFGKAMKNQIAWELAYQLTYGDKEV